MERNFTPKQVMLCEVEYTLEEFWKDLVEQVAREYPFVKREKHLSCQRLVYQVLYFTFNGNTPVQIDEHLGIPSGISESILEYHRDEFEMLKSVIMGMFLRNMQKANGFLSEQQNMDLVNAQLRNFHEINNL